MGAAVALLVAVVLAAWLVLRNDDDDGDQGAAVPDPVAVAPATIVSPAELKELAVAREQPVFWAGTEPGMTYELTEAEGDAIFIRYLPPGVSAEDPRPAYLTVATYSVEDGYSRVRDAAREPGATTRKLPDGGLMVVSSDNPSSVYLGYRGDPYQVEVYDPSPARARDLVTSGEIRPIR